MSSALVHYFVIVKLTSPTCQSVSKLSENLAAAFNCSEVTNYYCLMGFNYLNYNEIHSYFQVLVNVPVGRQGDVGC